MQVNKAIAINELLSTRQIAIRTALSLMDEAKILSSYNAIRFRQLKNTQLGS